MAQTSKQSVCWQIPGNVVHCDYIVYVLTPTDHEKIDHSFHISAKIFQWNWKLTRRRVLIISTPTLLLGVTPL